MAIYQQLRTAFPGLPGHPARAEAINRVEAAHGSVKKLFVLVKLNDVIFGPSIMEETPPWFEMLGIDRVGSGDVVEGSHGTVRLLIRVVLKGIHGRVLPLCADERVLRLERISLIH